MNDDDKVDVMPVPKIDDEDEIELSLPTMPAIHTDEGFEEEEVTRVISEFELPEMPSSPIEIAPVPKLDIKEEEVGSPKFNIPESELKHLSEEEKNEEKKEYVEIEEEEIKC